ncbi:hypothetical protein HK102_011820 [Quaeritorhiza haematococci]|nr:hypothetical protein HK102_011820 [Quaeritorhiza haematococci]
MSSDSFGRFGYELYPHENPAEATPCVLVRQIKEYVSYLFQKLRLSLNDANRLLSETVGGRRVGDFEGNEGSGREAVENEERWTGNEENGQTGVGIKERRSCVDRDREPEESPGNYLKDQDKSFSRQPARLYLCLIVGRGTNSGAWWLKDGASPSASRSKQDKDEEGGGGNDAQFYTLTRISSFNALTLTIYIHCDKFGGAFATRFSSSTPTKSTTSNSYAATIPPPPHLWLDFNNLNALRAIPTDFFDAIVVDWSTWRYMMPSAPGVIEEWSRILRGSTAVNEEVGKEDGGRHCLNPLGLKSGTLVFEGGISSVKVVPDESSMGKASTAQSNTTLERPSSSVSSEALYDSESPKRADRREHHISIEYDFNNPTHATNYILWESAQPCTI